MSKVISYEKAVELIPDGTTIMVGGFMGCGNPHQLIDALSKSSKGNFTLICNDGALLNGPSGEPYYGVAKLIHNKKVKHLITTHVGLNPEVAEQYNAGSIQLTLIPQGSFAEMLRAGGNGLGGVIAPTGYGTIVEESWHVHSRITIDGKDYLIEKPLRADIALIAGYRIDHTGNIWYKGTTRNFNVAMATAADLVIAEADYLVHCGDIEPENVVTPDVFVDYIVNGGNADA